MKIIVNGEEKNYTKEMTLLEMMNDLGLTDKVMAAAVNMNIVKEEAWASHTLSDGDKVELLDFVGGG